MRSNTNSKLRSVTLSLFFLCSSAFASTVTYVNNTATNYTMYVFRETNGNWPQYTGFVVLAGSNVVSVNGNYDGYRLASRTVDPYAVTNPAWKFTTPQELDGTVGGTFTLSQSGYSPPAPDVIRTNVMNIQNTTPYTVQAYWTKNGVLFDSQSIPPGGSASRTQYETNAANLYTWGYVTPTIDPFNPEAPVYVTNLLGRDTNFGNLTTTGRVFSLSGTNVAATNYNATALNFGTNVSSTELAREGTLRQIGNAQLDQLKANSQSEAALLTNIASILRGQGSNSLEVTVSNSVTLSNFVIITNQGDTNLLARWDAWTNAGNSLDKSITNAAAAKDVADGYSATANGSLATIQGLVTAPTMTAPSAPDMTISFMGYTVDCDPANDSRWSSTITGAKEFMRWLAFGLFTVCCFRRSDAIIHDTTMLHQSAAPNVQVLGNSVGASLAPVFVAVIATALVAVPVALITLLQSTSVDGGGVFGALSTSPLSATTGAWTIAVYLAFLLLPINTIVTLFFAWMAFIWQSRAVFYTAAFVIRLLIR